MLTADEVTTIFFLCDESSKNFDEVMNAHLLVKDDGKRHRKRKFRLSDGEVMTILVMFHLSHTRDLKFFYLSYIQRHCKELFPQTVSYNRFVELQSRVVVKMAVFLQLCCLGRCTGFSIIDSTPIRACHIKRERIHKTFKGIATKGKSSMGWFFGFKLHIVINDRGEIIDFLITQASVDDREPLKDRRFHDKLFGRLFADRGYVSQNLFDQLFVDGIHLITKLKKGMKNSLMLIQDKIDLRKRVRTYCIQFPAQETFAQLQYRTNKRDTNGCLGRTHVDYCYPINPFLSSTN